MSKWQPSRPPAAGELQPPSPPRTCPSKLRMSCSMRASELISMGRPLSVTWDSSAYIIPMEGRGLAGRQGASSRASCAAMRSTWACVRVRVLTHVSVYACVCF